MRGDLDRRQLPPSWVGASCSPSEVVTAEDGGWRVSADGEEPVFVGRRQEHLFARVRARLDVDGTGGLSVRIDPTHAVELEVSDGRVRAVWAVGDVRHVLGGADLPADGELEMRLLPDEGHSFFIGRGPDIVVAGMVAGRRFTELGRVDGRYLSTEVAGGMTGRMVGVVVPRRQRARPLLLLRRRGRPGGGRRRGRRPRAVGVVTETVPNDLSARYLPPPEPTLRDDGVRQHPNAVYAAVPGYRVLELDLWVPGGGPSPVVVWVHGGAWMAGNRRLLPPGLRPDQLFEELLDAGLAVATIEYRHAREAPFPAQLHDAKAAVRWLRHHADVLGLDPDRIGIAGESAGGHLAALVGLTAHRADLEGDVGVAGPSSAVAAVVDWYGVSSAETMPEFELPPEVAAALPPEALVPPLDVLLEGVDAETRAAVTRWRTCTPARRRSCCCTAPPTPSSRTRRASSSPRRCRPSAPTSGSSRCPARCTGGTATRRSTCSSAARWTSSPPPWASLGSVDPEAVAPWRPFRTTILIEVTVQNVARPAVPTLRVSEQCRVVLDNDWSGDPDGLVALAHHLLSPANRVVAVTSSSSRHSSGSPLARAADGATLARVASSARSGVRGGRGSPPAASRPYPGESREPVRRGRGDRRRSQPPGPAAALPGVRGPADQRRGCLPPGTCRRREAHAGLDRGCPRPPGPSTTVTPTRRPPVRPRRSTSRSAVPGRDVPALPSPWLS